MIQRWEALPVEHSIWKDADGEFVLYEDYEEARLLLADCLAKLTAEPREIGCHTGRHTERDFLKRVEEAINGN